MPLRIAQFQNTYYMWSYVIRSLLNVDFFGSFLVFFYVFFKNNHKFIVLYLVYRKSILLKTFLIKKKIIKLLFHFHILTSFNIYIALCTVFLKLNFFIFVLFYFYYNFYIQIVYPLNILFFLISL